MHILVCTTFLEFKMMTRSKEILVKMVLNTWKIRIKQTDDLLNQLNDDQLNSEIAPSKNRGIYVLGHLTAVHDQMVYILDIGTPAFPAYKTIFIDHPDKAILNIPEVTELRQDWKKVNTRLHENFELMQADDWFQRHTSVSQNDFEKEPYRNKLNIVLDRGNHLAEHLGQLIYLKK